MKRMLYLCLLLVVPLILQADHGRKRLNGKWINPYFNKTIKVKVKRHEIKVKGLSRRGWTYFTPIRRNVFEDCNGNRIKIKNIHQLVYINRYRGERIRFTKKGHSHRNHTCNSRCAIGDDFFTFSDHGNGTYYDDDYDDFYGDFYGDSWGNRNNRRNRNNRHGLDNFYHDSFNGQYHVRELDEYITITRTSYGLKAKRGNGNWVKYTQNRNRKNEYIDNKGNRYLVRSDGQLTWKNRNGTVSLNLKK